MIKKFIASLKWVFFSKGFNDFGDGYVRVRVCACVEECMHENVCTIVRKRISS